ncbi:unnamed protein product, partial [Phaeothamnion confervicola]
AAATRPPTFDTHVFVRELEARGLSQNQSVAVMEQVLSAIQQTSLSERDMVASRQNLADLKAEVSEKVFSTALKYDIGLRHLKELVEKDLRSMNSDIR